VSPLNAIVHQSQFDVSHHVGCVRHTLKFDRRDRITVGYCIGNPPVPHKRQKCPIVSQNIKVLLSDDRPVPLPDMILVLKSCSMIPCNTLSKLVSQCSRFIAVSFMPGHLTYPIIAAAVFRRTEYKRECRSAFSPISPCRSQQPGERSHQGVGNAFLIQS
jgi:hypothetical protein